MRPCGSRPQGGGWVTGGDDEGIPAVPAIARQNQADMSWFAWVFPTEAGIDLAADVWHEILGLVYYFVRGWYR